MSGRTRGSARFSVVVPAHDEGPLISRCLAFLDALEPGEAQVVVVANGCRDDTAVRARAAGAQVVEIPTASKVAALNAGDTAVTAFPRVYLDADVTLDVVALRRVVAALAQPGPHVAAPRAVFALDGSPGVVRLFYDAYTRLPYVRHGMIGSGVYAMNERGRKQFGPFPHLTADDLFVQRLFAPEQTTVLQDVTFTVQAPRSLRGLLAIRTRTAFGNSELAGLAGTHIDSSTRQTLGALRGLARSPRRLPGILAYLLVTAVARTRARSRTQGSWDRDTSTRTMTEGRT